MDRVYRMLKESRRMSAAAAGMVVGEDDETSKNKGGVAHGLTQDEKTFLQAVERGDTERMRRYVELVKHSKTPVKGFNINCVDPLGRFAFVFRQSALSLPSYTGPKIYIRYSRQQLSNGECPDDKIISELFSAVCVRQLCTVICTHRSSS